MKKSAAQDLLDALSGKISGEIRKTPVDRALYSTDASNYRILPLAAVIPRTERDVAVALAEARVRNVPVTARGAGTGLAGQAVAES